MVSASLIHLVSDLMGGHTFVFTGCKDIQDFIVEIDFHFSGGVFLEFVSYHAPPRFLSCYKLGGY